MMLSKFLKFQLFLSLPAVFLFMLTGYFWTAIVLLTIVVNTVGIMVFFDFDQNQTDVSEKDNVEKL